MYKRHIAKTLAERLQEPRSFIQIVMGPRQTGKTTAVRQAVQAAGLPYRYANANNIFAHPLSWIESEWQQARRLTKDNAPAVLVLDEIQSICGWSEIVKRLWDEDSWIGTNLRVVLCGPATLLKKGCAGTLTGRFGLIRSTHWSLREMKEAFGYTFEDYLLYGGYPGAAQLKGDYDRWHEYMRDSIIEATLSRDVLHMEDVRKPALMHSLFLLGAHHSAQVLPYRTISELLGDMGTVSTVARHLGLLDDAGLLCGLNRFGASVTKSTGSSARFLVHDASLMTATWSDSPGTLIQAPTKRSRLVESAVGCYLLAQSKVQHFDLMWWREGEHKADYVVRKGSSVYAIAVKSGRVHATDGLARFCRRFDGAQPIIVGDANISFESFIRGEVSLF